MSEQVQIDPLLGQEPAAAVQREAGLHRQLSTRQVAMIGLGSTIGTGLFLGSAISVKLAGPSVVLSFLIGAIVALPVMWALAEMSAAHPTAGAFGVHAQMYLNPWAGFAVRYTYWLCLVIVVGSEVVAAAIYCQYWFPHVPVLLWIAAFSMAMIYLNTLSIDNFGAIEFWFAMIKVVTIILFLVLGASLLLGFGFPRIGAANYTAYGGFFPGGWSGVGLGVVMAIFSYLGLEIMAATAGEAADPQVAVPRALRRTLLTLMIFYVGGLGIVVGIVPWNRIDLGQSPFVRVFETVGIPAAGHIMNFVVLSAALSSATCNLYFGGRLLFSLARGGYAPAALGRLNKRGMPTIAVFASSLGMLAAMMLAQQLQNTKAFEYMIGVAFFGGPFVWIMTLITHIGFRQKMGRAGQSFLRIAPGGSWSSTLGLVALLAVLISTWWVPSFHVTLLAGPPWLAFITVCYFLFRRATNRNFANAKK